MKYRQTIPRRPSLKPSEIAAVARAKIEQAKIKLARRDVNEFIPRVMSDRFGFGLVQRPLHLEIQSFLDKPRCGIDVARTHGKTWQAMGRLAHKIANNPNLRTKIVSNTEGLARERCRMVRETIESDKFKAVFPEIAKGNPWGDTAFTVKRKFIAPDPTCGAFGITTSHTGGRADLIVFDDVVNVESIRSEAERETIVEQVENVWLNLLEPDGIAWWLCTPWHKEDMSAVLKDGRGWPWLTRPIGPNFEPICAEMGWTREALEAKRKEIGEIAYARGFLLRAVAAEDCPIKSEWFRYWISPEEIPDGARRVMSIDPAAKKGRQNDFSVIGEVAYADPVLYVTMDCDVCRNKWNAPELLRAIRARADIVHPSEIAVEDVAYQASISDHLKEMQGMPYPVVPFSPGSDPDAKDKFTRAAWLSIMIENGRIRLRGDPRTGRVHESQVALYDELTGFPAAEHDDALDALFYAAKRAMVSMVSFGW